MKTAHFALVNCTDDGDGRALLSLNVGVSDETSGYQMVIDWHFKKNKDNKSYACTEIKGFPRSKQASDFAFLIMSNYKLVHFTEDIHFSWDVDYNEDFTSQKTTFPTLGVEKFVPHCNLNYDQKCMIERVPWNRLFIEDTFEELIKTGTIKC